MACLALGVSASGGHWEAVKLNILICNIVNSDLDEEIDLLYEVHKI
jgi:hypothetical protein